MARRPLIFAVFTLWLHGSAAWAEPRNWTVVIVGDANQRCAGVLIAPAAILTLAECVMGHDEVVVVIPVLWGMTLDLHAKRARIHPRFDPVGLKRADNPYNLALLELDRAFPAPYRPAPLASLTQDNSSDLQAASYGLSRVARGDREAVLSFGRFRSDGQSGRDPGVIRLMPLSQASECPNDRGAPVLVGRADDIQVIGLVTAEANEAGRCARGTGAILTQTASGWIETVLREWSSLPQATRGDPAQIQSRNRKPAP